MTYDISQQFPVNLRQFIAINGGEWFGSYGRLRCPVHNDRRPSLLVSVHNGKLFFNCLAGCDYQMVRDYFNHDLRAKYVSETVDEETKRRQMERLTLAKEIWDTSVPIKGTMGERYFKQHRRIDIDIPPTLRFHEGVKHFQGESYPAVIAKVEGILLDPSQFAIHCIFLEPDGSKLKQRSQYSSFKESKISIGSVRGGAVVLISCDTNKYVVAEGIETTLSLIEYKNLHNVNVLSCLSSSNMKNLNLKYHLKGLKPELVIAMDNDMAGIKAGHALADAAKLLGAKVKRFPFLNGKQDYNDAIIIKKTKLNLQGNRRNHAENK